MIANQAPTGLSTHSALVEMTLAIGPDHLRVAQTGGGLLILAESTELREHRGELTVSIDGQIETATVEIEPVTGPARKYRATYHWHN